jgi:hypothetical protein
MHDEGLADVEAASPFRLPRLHPVTWRRSADAASTGAAPSRRPRSRTSPPRSANDRATSAGGPLERATHCRPTARRQKIRLPGPVRGPLGWVRPSGPVLRSGRKSCDTSVIRAVPGGRTGEEGREGGRAENGRSVNRACIPPMLVVHWRTSRAAVDAAPFRSRRNEWFA